MAPRRGTPVPKPRALRLLNGARADKVNNAEPVPRDDDLQPPEDLDPRVRKVWDFTVEHLRHMGTAAACDRDALLAYCEAVATHRRASHLLSRSDVLIQGRNGNLVRNPTLAVQRDAAYAIRMFAQEFGLTPSGRTRIVMAQQKVTESDPANPFSGVG